MWYSSVDREEKLAKFGCLPQPGTSLTILFILLFSGPPKLRIRDSEASLYGEIDFAIVAQALVWLLAGCWVAYQLWCIHGRKRPRLRFSLSQRLAVAVILFLGLSTFVSVAPLVTAFKVYQILVEFLFAMIFVEWYGVERCLSLMFVACTLLCLATLVFVLVAPDLVLFTSETGFPRLRGLAITDTALVSTFGIVLLFARVRKMSTPLFLLFAFFFGGLLFASLARSAWLTVAVIFAIAVWKRPRTHSLKWIYVFWVMAVIGLIAGAGSLLNQLRDPESVYDLSARFGLWAYIGTATLDRSPWLGLGYLAGARETGLQFNSDLGSGHSIFFDVFVGGGILSVSLFVILFIVLGVEAVKLLRERDDALSFGACCLFVAVLIPGLVGADIDSSPSGFTLWSLVTILPMLAKQEVVSRLREVAFRPQFDNHAVP
jgi:hypothetical protein